MTDAVSNIIQTKLSFARALDTRDWPLFEALLSPTIFVDFRAFGGPHGHVPRGNVVGMFQHAFRRQGMRSQQVYSNFEIEAHGDTAAMRSYLIGSHFLSGDPAGESWVLHAAYHDRLRHADSGWIFTELVLEVLFTTGNLAIVA